MRIFITGASGFIGQALCASLLAQGHQLTVLTRNAGRTTRLLGASVDIWETLDRWQADTSFDAVINLAGESIINWPWTTRRKQQLWESRVTLTRHLATRISQAPNPPAVFLSGSAIGYYGDTGDRVVDETAAAGQDYAARLCAAWEEAALSAESPKTRVCLLRTGLVLHPAGGMLARMLLPFRLGLGGRIGKGTQWMSWIHRDDQVGIMLHLLATPEAQGVYNLTAPEPVPNGDLTLQLATALQRPARWTTPAWLLSLVLGERASLLLAGQRVSPKRILASGYRFQYPALSGVMQSL